MRVFEASAESFRGPGCSSTFRCALGRSGVVAAADKREGDGASPAGLWPLRRIYYRPDRIAPDPKWRLPAEPIRPALGWCDDPCSPEYNRPVALPFPASHELMWRADGLYDLVVTLGYNDDPPVSGLGSAIFLHCSRPDYAPTEGCVALAAADLLRAVAEMRPSDALRIVA